MLLEAPLTRRLELDLVRLLVAGRVGVGDIVGNNAEVCALGTSSPDTPANNAPNIPPLIILSPSLLNYLYITSWLAARVRTGVVNRLHIATDRHRNRVSAERQSRRSVLAVDRLHRAGGQHVVAASTHCRHGGILGGDGKVIGAVRRGCARKLVAPCHTTWLRPAMVVPGAGE